MGESLRGRTCTDVAKKRKQKAEPSQKRQGRCNKGVRIQSEERKRQDKDRKTTRRGGKRGVGRWLKSCIITAWQLKHALTHMSKHTRTLTHATYTHLYVTSRHITAPYGTSDTLRLASSMLGLSPLLPALFLIHFIFFFIHLHAPVCVHTAAICNTLRTNRMSNWEIYSAADRAIKAGGMSAPTLPDSDSRSDLRGLLSCWQLWCHSVAGGNVLICSTSKRENLAVWKHWSYKSNTKE